MHVCVCGGGFLYTLWDCNWKQGEFLQMYKKEKKRGGGQGGVVVVVFFVNGRGVGRGGTP